MSRNITAPDLCDQINVRLGEEPVCTPRETRRSAQRLALMAAMSDGTVKQGERLPPEAEMAQRLQLAPGPVRSALGHLQDPGLILRRRGDGTRVADAEPISPSVWPFRFRVLATRRALRLTSAQIEALRSTGTGPGSDHLGPGPDTVLRRRLCGDGMRIGAEMYLPRTVIKIGTIDLGNL